MMLIALLFLPAATVSAIPADRKFGVLELLRCTPITGTRYLTGKILGVLSAVLLVSAIMLALFFTVLRDHPFLQPPFWFILERQHIPDKTQLAGRNSITGLGNRYRHPLRSSLSQPPGGHFSRPDFRPAGHLLLVVRHSEPHPLNWASLWLIKSNSIFFRTTTRLQWKLKPGSLAMKVNLFGFTTQVGFGRGYPDVYRDPGRTPWARHTRPVVASMEGELLMISVIQLTKNYGKKVQALRGVDLEIGTGMFGLVGPNGAGKTTLMRILAGLLRPTTGKVTVLGNDVTTRQGKLAVKSLLGYLPQELGLYPDLSAYEFMEYIALLKGMTDKAERQKQLADTLELVGLAQDAKRRLRTFSGGMKRRVGIAQALLGHPQLLIVDEPTSGLDPEERVRLRTLLSEMSSRCTVILSTHIIEDISQSCNKMAVINLGQVLFLGSPRELIDNVRGKVWQVTTKGERPDGGAGIVSSVQVQDGIQYRLVGDRLNEYPAIPVEPSLEDGYIWLMQQSRLEQVNKG